MAAAAASNSSGRALALGAVQGKMQCAFEIEVVEVPSKKRAGQNYSVRATDRLRPEFTAHLAAGTAVATEKLDGTCVLIKRDPISDKVSLWPRRDSLAKLLRLGSRRIQPLGMPLAAKACLRQRSLSGTLTLISQPCLPKQRGGSRCISRPMKRVG
eukprot:m.146123 g.146123  ORF g.146123 m.146123 type:complete len:156 (-) comp17240_c0_seq1:703-1170(-)